MATILLVEDDPQVRSMLLETLSQEGYGVVEAANGVEAESAFRARPTDLVIMDIVMPEKDGVETLHALRREFPHIKVIAISGGSANIQGEHLLKTADRLGAIRTFSKPVDMGLLLSTVEEALAGK